MESKSVMSNAVQEVVGAAEDSQSQQHGKVDDIAALIARGCSLNQFVTRYVQADSVRARLRVGTRPSLDRLYLAMDRAIARQRRDIISWLLENDAEAVTRLNPVYLLRNAMEKTKSYDFFVWFYTRISAHQPIAEGFMALVTSGGPIMDKEILQFILQVLNVSSPSEEVIRSIALKCLGSVETLRFYLSSVMETMLAHQQSARLVVAGQQIESNEIVCFASWDRGKDEQPYAFSVRGWYGILCHALNLAAAAYAGAHCASFLYLLELVEEHSSGYGADNVKKTLTQMLKPLGFTTATPEQLRSRQAMQLINWTLSDQASSVFALNPLVAFQSACQHQLNDVAVRLLFDPRYKETIIKGFDPDRVPSLHGSVARALLLNGFQASRFASNPLILFEMDQDWVDFMIRSVFAGAIDFGSIGTTACVLAALRKSDPTFEKTLWMAKMGWLSNLPADDLYGIVFRQHLKRKDLEQLMELGYFNITDGTFPRLDAAFPCVSEFAKWPEQADRDRVLGLLLEHDLVDVPSWVAPGLMRQALGELAVAGTGALPVIIKLLVDYCGRKIGEGFGLQPTVALAHHEESSSTESVSSSSSLPFQHGYGKQFHLDAFVSKEDLMSSERRQWESSREHLALLGLQAALHPEVLDFGATNDFLPLVKNASKFVFTATSPALFAKCTVEVGEVCEEKDAHTTTSASKGGQTGKGAIMILLARSRFTAVVQHYSEELDLSIDEPMSYSSTPLEPCVDGKPLTRGGTALGLLCHGRQGREAHEMSLQQYADNVRSIVHLLRAGADPAKPATEPSKSASTRAVRNYGSSDGQNIIMTLVSAARPLHPNRTTQPGPPTLSSLLASWALLEMIERISKDLK